MDLSKIMMACVEQNVELSLDGDSLEVSFEQRPSEDLLAALALHKVEIIQFISEQQKIKSGASEQSITVANRTGTIPLSFAQQRLWLLDKVDGGSSHYNMPVRLSLHGSLSLQILERAFHAIVMRHESLRTCFPEDSDGQPFQLVLPPGHFKVQYHNLSSYNAEEQTEILNRIKTEDASKVFDLRQDVMLRVQVLELSENDHEVLVTMHHIASDGWSLGILIDEFSALYTAFAHNLENPLRPLDIQYADYAQWQRSSLQGDVLTRQLSYWSEQLADAPALHSLPLDRPRPAIQSFTGRTHYSRISAQTTKTLNAICQNADATLYMGLHAVFSVLLSRYSNETDIVIGCPIANREQPEIAPLIGFFINTLVLRSDLSDNPSFVHLLARTRQMLLDSYSHQQVPFEQIVEKLEPTRSLSHSPFFQIVLVLHNNQKRNLELPGLTIRDIDQSCTIAKYDLLLNVSEDEQGLSLGWVFNTSLFNTDTIERMSVHFEALLVAMLSTPEQNIFELPMLSHDEYTMQQKYLNGISVESNKEKIFHRQFEIQVRETPEKTAVVFGEEKLSFFELNYKANRMARLLIDTGIQSGGRVGIYINRSAEMLIAVLAVMKAGATYVPLDTKYPSKRIEFILLNADIGTVLLNSSSMQNFPLNGVDVLLMDNAVADDKWLAEYSSEDLSDIESGLTPDTLAYILYTSGSTGHPKGVMVPHHCLCHYLHHADQYFNENVAGGIVSSPLAFDATLTTLLTPLLAGKVVKLLPEVDELNQLAKQLCENQPWLFKITPAHLEVLSQLIPKGFQGTAAHQIVVGGEQLTYQLLKLFREQLLPNATFINEYGPTETVVGCSVYSLPPAHQQSAVPCTEHDAVVPIGRPISNTRLYVMSLHMQPLPVNCIGELYVGGDGVTKGYLKCDDLNKHSFIEHPILTGERIYRTGDLVRLRADGELIFIGRVDHQVKIRGFRIEVSEIENAFRAHCDIRDVLVMVKSASDDKCLVAYVVPTQFPVDDGTFELQREALANDYLNSIRQHLPHYMIPSVCLVLSAMPLTLNGKIDLEKLPLPFADDANRQAYTEPRTDNERYLCEKWQELLRQERVGITDNFFGLGGHSLSATRLFAQLNQERGLNLSLQLIFTLQTVEQMAAHIDFLQAQKAVNTRQAVDSGNENLIEVEW